jgi:HPt (histidine-containing phosphotransfer) domain-containing protein
VPDADAPTIDEEVLAEMMAATGDDIGFVGELLDTYLADTPAQLDAMAAAVDADDAAALVRPAHTVKSSSASMGAMRLSQLARDLEMAGRSGALGPGDRATMNAARSEWPPAVEALKAWIERASAT